MPSKPALDRARVVAAAVVVADREGIDRLTLRALAAELRTSPMAIYHYRRGARWSPPARTRYAPC